MPHYLDRREAAKYLTARGLKCSHNTLQKFATIGGGPEYAIFGNRALYTPQALDSWAKARLSAPRKSTSEAVISRRSDQHDDGGRHAS
jgi:hypothetical protein